MESRIINGVKCYAPNSREELIKFTLQNNKIVVAVNATKIIRKEINTLKYGKLVD
jgi:UDP-N-acetyl-D-mannosaminouronate:lipid I N-acetyl-D-mannosaminouronosyltransferase